MLYTIVDTAGLKETFDIVEKEGIKRAKKQIEIADIVIFLVDSTQITLEDIGYFNKIFTRRMKDKKIILALNKIDLKQFDPKTELPLKFKSFPTYRLSAKSGDGIQDLRAGLKEISIGKQANIPDKSFFITNLRHKVLLERAKKGLEKALEDLKNSASNEFTAIDLRDGINAIGEITGEITSQEILDNIFAHFCIGK
jgi:tRNA modification GTPase